MSSALNADSYWLELELQIRIERETYPGATVYGPHVSTPWWHVHFFTIRRPDRLWALLECRCGQRFARARGFGYQPVDRAWLERDERPLLPPRGGSQLRPPPTSVPGPGLKVLR